MNESAATAGENYPSEQSPDVEAAATRPLRLWPAIIIVALQWAAIAGPRLFDALPPAIFMGMFFGAVGGTILFLVWWLFLSRAPRRDRWFGFLFVALLCGITYLVNHPSVGWFGLVLFALPWATTAVAAWLLVSRPFQWPLRRIGAMVAVMLCFGYCSLLRFDGTDGNMNSQLSYRWTPTAEQKFLAEIAGSKPKSTPTDSVAKPLTLDPGDWPGFRGPDRDGRRTGVRIATDWKTAAPQKVWRRRVGPGWSSFAVVGNRFYTQEQRGDTEVVVCGDTETGNEVWAHTDATRFTEVVAGPGPRATPTFFEGCIYALGANGKLNCLDAATGKVKWSRDIVADSKAKIPQWGFAASPLVSQGVVTVFAGGEKDQGVLGYKIESGDPAWHAGAGGHSYCSLHPARIGGVDQIMVSTELGLQSFQPAKGNVLWTHDWKLDDQMARVTQPTVVGDSDVLFGAGFGFGTRRVHVGKEADKWDAKEVWTTKSIKPYYNDLVVHKGHLYGFDGAFFTCVSLDDGKAKWRSRGYGNGQVLLLSDQDLLVILSETGEVAAVDAVPDGRKERGKFQAIEGKTWNHPVVAHGKLLVRNGEEAACYRLADAK